MSHRTLSDLFQFHSNKQWHNWDLNLGLLNAVTSPLLWSPLCLWHRWPRKQQRQHPTRSWLQMQSQQHPQVQVWCAGESWSQAPRRMRVYRTQPERPSESDRARGTDCRHPLPTPQLNIWNIQRAEAFAGGSKWLSWRATGFSYSSAYSQHTEVRARYKTWPFSSPPKSSH